MKFGVVEHGGADAELAVLSHEDVMVDAPFAALPEGGVIGQLVEGHGHVAQFGVHLHHGSTACRAGGFRVGPARAGQAKRGSLDALGQPQAAVVGVNNQT